MLFNSYEFIFALLPLTFFIYFYLNKKSMTEVSKCLLVFTAKKLKDLSSIILKLFNNEELMQEEVTLHFKIENQNQKSLLEKKRKMFWSDFKNDISVTPFKKEKYAKKN